MDERKLLYGYDLDEIDEVASELFQMLAEQQVPVTFAILALCRTITMLGSETDMDLACVMIDQLRDVLAEDALDEFEDVLTEEDEDDDTSM